MINDCDKCRGEVIKWDAGDHDRGKHGQRKSSELRNIH